MAVYFGQRELARGQGCCCCCWDFSFRFFTLQTRPTLYHAGQRLMNLCLNECLTGMQCFMNVEADEQHV